MLYTYEKKNHDHYEHINMEFVGNDLHVISNFQLKKMLHCYYCYSCLIVGIVKVIRR